MNIREACDELNTSPNTLYRWVRLGHIPAPKKKRVQVLIWQDVNMFDDRAIKRFKKKLGL